MTTSTEIIHRDAETEVAWINAAGDQVEDGIRPYIDRVGRELANWVTSTRTASQPSIFNRSAYVAPENPYALMEVARNAVDNDDVIGGVCDVTEGLIFQGLKWEASDPEDADIFNQISRDLDLDQFARMWHREDFTYSQAVVGVWWGKRSYKLRGKSETGTRRKKTKDVTCPVALTLLDPRKVVPLKPGPFGQDRLAWSATREEYAAASSGVDGVMRDAVLDEFTLGPIQVGQAEATYLQGIGIDPKRLLALNPMSTFRIARTKAPYDRFVTPRLKSTFPLLDLKQQLMEADRVSLVGAANFILLVRQGDKDDPALPEELRNLQENFKVVAKLPVVIGDHRLNIDIITPDQEYVLAADKYDTLDRRILSRTLGALTIASSGQRNESTLTVARGVARQLENRRHMFKRVLERELARAIIEHPYNEGKFDDEPNLTFTPRNVQLDADAQITQAIQNLRNTGDLSRESTLEYFGFDQAVEALRREFEEESGFDDIFQTKVPFDSKDPGAEAPEDKRGVNGGPEAPASSGARGGRPVGGGKSKQSPTAKPRTPNGNASTKEQ